MYPVCFFKFNCAQFNYTRFPLSVNINHTGIVKSSAAAPRQISDQDMPFFPWMIPPRDDIMNKTASQADANAELARAFADIWRASHMRKEPFCTRNGCKMSGFRMCGAMRERGTRRAARSFIHTRSATASHSVMPSSLEHLRTLKD